MAKAKTAQARTMEELLAKSPSALRALVPGQEIEGVVVELGPKSLVLDIGTKSEGLVVDREFVQAASLIKKLSPGDKVTALVLVPETNSGQALLSLREAAEIQAWSELEQGLKEGKVFTAKVVSIVRGGLAVEILGVQAFIPGSQTGSSISGNLQNSLDKNLKVKVIEIDKTNSRIVLSEKAVSEADVLAKQNKILEKIKKGDKFRGEVVGLTSFGAFVRVEKDGIAIDGLVHLSELSRANVKDPSEVLKKGDLVDVVVIGKGLPAGRQGNSRLALSIKELQEDPWEKISEGKYVQEKKVSGRVIKTGSFGAFVELEPGIEGLLRASKIPSDISVKEGQEIDCFVEELDKTKHKISLGLVLKSKPVGYK